MSDILSDRQHNIGLAHATAQIFNDALPATVDDQSPLAILSAQGAQESTLNILESRNSSPWFAFIDAVVPGLAARHAHNLLQLAEYGAGQELVATKDHLTGLENRRGLMDALGRMVALVHRRNVDQGIGILILDSVNFKSYNDTIGYDKGDTLLQFWASQFRKNLRSEDLKARYGGDEFILVMYGKSEEQIREFLFDGRSTHDPNVTNDGVINVINAEIENRVVQDYAEKGISIKETVPGKFRSKLFFLPKRDIVAANSVSSQVDAIMTKIGQEFAIIKDIKDEKF